MDSKLQKVYFQLCSVSVFAGVTAHPLFQAFEEYCRCEGQDACGKMKAYAKFVSEIYKSESTLTELVSALVFADENVYYQARIHKKQVDAHMVKSARRELQILSEFAALSADNFAEDMDVAKTELPQFGSFIKPLGGAYEEMLTQKGAEIC